MRYANEREKADTKSSWVDPDDAPELTDDFFTKAKMQIGDKLVSKEEFRKAAKKALRGRRPERQRNHQPPSVSTTTCWKPSRPAAKAGRAA